MPKITKRTLDAVQPGDPIIWDSELGGFGLRSTKAGSKSYVLDYRTKTGIRRRLTVGRADRLPPEEARHAAIKMLAQVANGVDPATEREQERNALTVGELADLYLKEGPAAKVEKRPRSWATDASNIRAHIKPLIGSKLMKALTATEVQRLQQDIAVGKTKRDEKTKSRGRAIVTGGPGIAARSVRVLSAMYGFAIKRRIAAENPCRGVDLFKGEKMQRFLSSAELARLGDALRNAEVEGQNRLALTAIRLLVLTGCRKDEIAGLRWEWVDFERRSLNLPHSKTGAKTVPLGSVALEVLAGLSPKRSGWVLVASRGEGHIVGLQKVWAVVRSKAELPGLRLHDLRHSFASVAVAAGDSLFLIGKVLGHRQAKTTEGYAHLSNDPLLDVADRTSARIASALAGGKGVAEVDPQKLVAAQ